MSEGTLAVFKPWIRCARYVCIAILPAMLLSACERERGPSGQSEKQLEQGPAPNVSVAGQTLPADSPPLQPVAEAALEAAGVDDQAQRFDDRPVFRVLTVRTSLGGNAETQGVFPQTRELRLVQQYATQHKLRLELVYVDSLESLLPALLQGRGDLAAANLTDTRQRRELVNFTTPVAFVKEMVVGRKEALPVDAQDLGGREITVNPASSYHQSLQSLLRKRFQPEFVVKPLADDIRAPQVLQGLREGDYDLTVLDSNVIDALLPEYPELEAAFALGGVRPIAWAVAPQRDGLLKQLNAFLARHQLIANDQQRYREDLPALKKRGVLRLATRNNAATYFVWRGRQKGFDFELVNRFAQSQGLRLEVLVPGEGQNVFQMVREGLADMAAASLTISPARQRDGIVFSRFYNEISEVIVARQGDEPLQSPADLEGRRIAVRRNSSYYETLQLLRQIGMDIELEIVPESVDTQYIIAKVATGEYDLTLADSHIADIEMTWRDDVRVAFTLGQKRQHGWVLHESAPQLLKAVNAFLDKEYRGLHYNLAVKKYFKNHKSIRRMRNHQEARPGSRLSPYDKLVEQYASRYGFDWRLLISQMFQESRFDPNVTSWAGAEGLMQLLPETARELGLVELKDPEVGIHAGVKYLDWLRRRFEAELDPGNRLWFALAAYNAGLGHVRDARRLAASKGWDKNQWFGHVEKAMLLLSRPKYANEARHGYVRGREPVAYVQQIRSRFKAYVDVTRQSEAGGRGNLNNVTYVRSDVKAILIPWLDRLPQAVGTFIPSVAARSGQPFQLRRFSD